MLSVYFKIGFLNFSNICYWYTLELPLDAIPMCTYNICQFKMSLSVFHHKLFQLTYPPCSLFLMFQCNKQVFVLFGVHLDDNNRESIL